MSSTGYQGTALKAVTIDGQTVRKVILDGVVVWEDKPDAVGICMVATGGGTGDFAWVYDDGTQVEYDTAQTVDDGTALGVVLVSAGGGGGEWHIINADGVRQGVYDKTMSTDRPAGIVMTGNTNSAAWTQIRE